MSDHQADLTPLDFGNLAPIEVSITNLFGKNYILREPTDDAVLRYQGASLGSARIEDGRVIQTNLGKLQEAESQLVADCLHPVDDDGKAMHGKGVVVGIIRAWPRGVRNSLYERLKQMVPYLTPAAATVEGIDAQIAALQNQRTKLQAKSAQEEAEEEAKNS